MTIKSKYAAALLAGTSALAIAGSADATTFFTGGPITDSFTNVNNIATTYAIEGIPQSTGQVTISAGVNLVIQNSSTAASAGASENGTLTLSLPAGVTFVSQPDISCVSGAGVFGTAAGPVLTSTATGAGAAVAAGVNVATSAPGQNFATYQIATTVSAGPLTNSICTLESFVISGATSLLSPTNASANTPDFLLSAQFGGFTVGANQAVFGDAAPISTGVAESAFALAFDAGGAIAPAAVLGTVPPNITFSATSIGTRFNTGAVAETTVTPIGGIVNNLNTTPLSNSTTSAAFTFGAQTATVVVTGNFQNFTGAYLQGGATPTVCGTAPDAAAPAAITGTVTDTSVTFAGVPVAAGTRAVCLESTGSNILPENPAFTVTSTIAGFTQNDPGAAPVTAAPFNLRTTLDPLVYAGSTARLNYTYGDDANYGTAGVFAYLNRIRVTNPSPNSALILGLFEPDDAGQTPFAGVIVTLQPGEHALLDPATLGTALGVTYTGSDFRGVLQIFSPNASVQASSILLDPNGGINNIN